MPKAICSNRAVRLLPVVTLAAGLTAACSGSSTSSSAATAAAGFPQSTSSTKDVDATPAPGTATQLSTAASGSTQRVASPTTVTGSTTSAAHGRRTAHPSGTRHHGPRPLPTTSAPTTGTSGSSAPVPPGAAAGPQRAYPWHTGIVATTFWIGEIFDPSASDGSQVLSTYDSLWMQRYGGCDGVAGGGRCSTEPRTAANDYFPTKLTPRENPFYLDLPFDDVNNATAFARRGTVVPWANDPGFAGRSGDRGFSFMKNRWVELRRAGRTCYGQIQDAGPGEYADERYVFGSDDARPKNTRYNGAGADVSPALNGCLAFSDLDGQDDRIDWRFVDDAAVPAGPWKRIVTTSGVHQ